MSFCQSGIVVVRQTGFKGQDRRESKTLFVRPVMGAVNQLDFTEKPLNLKG